MEPWIKRRPILAIAIWSFAGVVAFFIASCLWAFFMPTSGNFSTWAAERVVSMFFNIPHVVAGAFFYRWITTDQISKVN
jgi:hypothetical protein